MTARHGTTARRAAGCNCLPCRAAAARYKAMVDRAKGRGDWQPFVDAAPVRAHCQELMSLGMRITEIAAAANVAPTVVSAVLYGKPADSRAPTKRVRPWTAEALLAVPTPALVAGGRGVPAERTWALLRALVANGYSVGHLSQRLGHTSRQAFVIGRSPRVFASTAAAVERLADELATIPGPSSRARAHAAKHGWTTDALWADLGVEETDDAAVDHVIVDALVAGDKPGNRPNDSERIEAARVLRDRGWTTGRIAERLRMNGEYTARLLARLDDEKTGAA